MTKKAKEYTVRVTYKGRETDYTGTMEHLTTEVFGYHLECGNSWNRKINRYPKTGKQLISALEKSEQEVRGSCYNQKSYRLIEA